MKNRKRNDQRLDHKNKNNNNNMMKKGNTKKNSMTRNERVLTLPPGRRRRIGGGTGAETEASRERSRRPTTTRRTTRRSHNMPCRREYISANKTAAMRKWTTIAVILTVMIVVHTVSLFNTPTRPFVVVSAFTATTTTSQSPLQQNHERGSSPYSILTKRIHDTEIWRERHTPLFVSNNSDLETKPREGGGEEEDQENKKENQPKQTEVLSEEVTNGSSSSSSTVINGNFSYDETAAADTGDEATIDTTDTKMSLLWCQTDRCVDVIREEVVGQHNQIVLNGPATGQVAYRWSQKPALPYRSSTSSTANSNPEKTETSRTRTPSVLILVKKGDRNLMRMAAETVSELTSVNNREKDDDDDEEEESSSSSSIRVLLAPDLAAKLKHYHGVDNPYISLFESPIDGGSRSSSMSSNIKQAGDFTTIDPNQEFNWRVRHVDDDEEEWVQDMMLYKQESTKHFPDLIVSLGGDGLLLHASMMFQGPFPPLLAISGGSLGFLTPFDEEELVDAVRIALGMSPSNRDDVADEADDSVCDDDLQVFPPNMDYDPYGGSLVAKPPSHLFDSTIPKSMFGLGDFICMSIRMRLDCRIVNQEGIVRARYNVLNEVVVDRGSSPYLAALECFCDDVHLTTVQADGIIFATPTGSTAYSMAAGGSVVHPGVPSILVTPICPHVLSFRSMVFPDSVVLTCHVPEDARATASIAFDGKHRRELQRGDSVQIQMSRYPIPTINKQSDTSDWLESLKRSFNFNTRPRQQPL